MTPLPPSPAAPEDLGAFVDVVDQAARRRARQLGHRAIQNIRVVATLADYEALIGAAAMEVGGHRRGLCGNAGGTRRVIWVAPASQDDRLESLTHEYAHAVLPWRLGHTETWLQVHCAALRAVSCSDHVITVEASVRAQYRLYTPSAAS